MGGGSRVGGHDTGFVQLRRVDLRAVDNRDVFRLASASALVCGLLAVACATVAVGASSGVRGRVLFGPTCPLERPGHTCTRPYRTWLSIRREPANRLVAHVRSSAAGLFSVALAPGNYLLVAQGGQPFPHTTPHRFTVDAGR